MKPHQTPAFPHSMFYVGRSAFACSTWFPETLPRQHHLLICGCCIGMGRSMGTTIGSSSRGTMFL